MIPYRLADVKSLLSYPLSYTLARMTDQGGVWRCRLSAFFRLNPLYLLDFAAFERLERATGLEPVTFSMGS